MVYVQNRQTNEIKLTDRKNLKIALVNVYLGLFC